MFDHRGTYYAETIWRSDIVAAAGEWRDETKGQARRLFEMERRNAKLGADTEKEEEEAEEDRKDRSLVGNMSLLDSLGMVGRRYTTSLFITGLP